MPGIHSLRPSTRVLRRSSDRTERHRVTRAVRAEIISLAGLIGAPVRNQSGQEVGRLVDLVARIHGTEDYPPITGLVVRVGRRRTFLDASTISHVERRAVFLRSSTIDLREFIRRPGEVLLGRDVLDHQLVDVDGVQVIRAADLYVLPVGSSVRLVGVDVSLQALLRRLGPARTRVRPTPERVIDWADVEPFGDTLTETPSAVRLRDTHGALRRLRPGELADLLEDLGRPGRQEVLASLDPETLADALEEMDPDELAGLLREAEPAQAGPIIAAMEPDEAVDALRDLEPADQREILAAMPEAAAERLLRLLGYAEDRAGGFMTTTLARAGVDETIGDAVGRLAERRGQRTEIDAVVVVDEQGYLVADVPLFDLLLADQESTFAELLADLDEDDPVTVSVDALVDDVAAQLVESRRGSVLVVDSQSRPVGRILADDVVDALSPEHGRLRFPRLLQ